MGTGIEELHLEPEDEFRFICETQLCNKSTIRDETILMQYLDEEIL